MFLACIFDQTPKGDFSCLTMFRVLRMYQNVADTLYKSSKYAEFVLKVADTV